MSTSPFLKSMADGCLTSLPTLFFASKASSHPFLSIPSKSSKPLHLSSLISINNRRLHVSPLVAQTSDWAQEGGASEVEGGVALAEGDGEESYPGPPEAEESYPEPPEEAKLFVGNLPFDMDSEKLAQLFDQSGIVEVAEVIYNRETEQSRGFGFVTMSTVEEAEKAVEMFHRYDVSGRLLTVNKAAPRGTRPERTRDSQPSLRIYVGNLPWQVDDGRLEQVFSEHGKVLDARVVCDRETGRSRGFGFVTMASKNEVDDAIAALDGQSMDGRALRVNVAEERPRRGSF